MEILNFFNKIYSNANFPTYLIATFAILVVLFLIILILGLKDSKKILTRVKDPEDYEVISFDLPKEADQIKEDVTFEMPLLTKNLAEFKRSIELEISNNMHSPEVEPEYKENTNLIKKPTKVLDIDEIEDTTILPTYPKESNQAFTTLEETEKLEIILPRENSQKCL